MADEEATETLAQRHKREQKELQGKIQALKHGIPKGDKKRKKQVTIEIAQLQAELDQKQQEEIDDEKSTTVNGEDNTSLNEAVEDKLTIQENGEADLTEDRTQQSGKKTSKAQKRREKKEQEERERQKRLVEGEKESANHVHNLEAAQFDKILKENYLTIREVQPDGDCLYNSVIAQKFGSSTKDGLKELRQKTADYMRTNEADFLPFTSNTKTGDMLSTEEYGKYCDDIENTTTWGGQLEIRAISNVYQQRVEIYQANAPRLVIGEEHVASTPLRLSYHRHQYGLGEHYNALVPTDDTPST